MANKTNTTINGYKYFRLTRKVGRKQNKRGEWVPEYKTFYGKSEKEAKARYEKYMQRGGDLSQDRCFGALMDLFIDRVFLPDSSLKDTTKARYVNAYRNVFASSPVLGKDIEELSGLDLQGVLSGSTCAPSSVRASYKLLKRFYKYLDAQRIARDITPGLVLPAVDHKRKSQDIETFTAEELQRFKENIPPSHRLRLLVVLGIETGARVAELAALTYDDIKDGSITINKQLAEVDPVKQPDGEKEKTRAEITPTKTAHSVRAVPLTAYALEEIQRHRQWHEIEMQKNGYQTRQIFTTETGSLYFKSTLRTAFRRLCKSCGVTPRGFHVFRHTFGSRLAAAGVPIQTVSQLMGHSDISVTAAYYINIPAEEKRAAIEKLNT